MEILDRSEIPSDKNCHPNARQKLFTSDGRRVGKIELVDPMVVFRLASIGMTQGEVAAALGISRDSLNSYFKEQFWAGKALLVEKLRQKQLDLAMAGSERLLVHMSKHQLGESDTGSETDSENRQPIRIAFATRSERQKLSQSSASEVEGQKDPEPDAS
jgi:hypothetical protein